MGLYEKQCVTRTRKNLCNYVFTAIFLRNQVFWNVTLCSWAGGSKVFEGVLRNLGPLKIKVFRSFKFWEGKAQRHSIESQKN
jgi:hypothetical protein